MFCAKFEFSSQIFVSAFVNVTVYRSSCFRCCDNAFPSYTDDTNCVNYFAFSLLLIAVASIMLFYVMCAFTLSFYIEEVSGSE